MNVADFSSRTVPDHAEPWLLPSRQATQAWLGLVQSRIERELVRVLDIGDEQALAPGWSEALARMRAYTLRPAKRIRPALLIAGHGFGRAGAVPPAGVWRFAAGLELLHTFLLIHDDIADQAELRRGGPALHREFGRGKAGEDLAMVAGDHLFARATEVMLESGLPRAAEVTRWYLGICRHTAVGQYLDLRLSSSPLSRVPLRQTLQVARLKTARYGFSAPLMAGARLASASPEVAVTLEQVGHFIGLAYQLRDDLIGLFGDPAVTGKPADSDLAQGRRTFPVIAAYLRAPEATRREMEMLWAGGTRDPGALARARALVEHHGGGAATQRAIGRSTRIAVRALRRLPTGSLTHILTTLITQLATRIA